MSGPGGEANKVGNRYELRWTVYCLLDILDGKADSIRLEPPGAPGTGIEFEIRRQGVIEYHQAKYSAGYKRRWSLPRLGKEGVLAAIRSKLQDSAATFVFVSASDACELRELADRASGVQAVDEYKKDALSSDLRDQFSQLCSSCDDWSEEVALAGLQRLRVQQRSEDDLEDIVGNRISRIIDTARGDAYSTLANLVSDRVDREKVLTAWDIWEHLKTNGFSRNEWYKDESRVSCICEATEAYVHRLRQELIAGRAIPRQEAAEIIESFRETSGNRVILAAGDAGTGKSGVLEQVVTNFQKEHWPVLAFRVDNLGMTNLPDEIGQQLGLPRSPAHTLAAVAQCRDCLLVIDQLDAISTASGRNPELWGCIDRIIRQALVGPNIRILMACRHFDLKNDDRLRRLVSSSGIAHQVNIQHLSHDTVRQVVTDLGLEARRLSTSQLDLLSVPLHLRLLADTAEDSQDDPLRFETSSDLFDRYWDRKQDQAGKRVGQAVRWADAIDALADHMSDHQCLTAPRYVLDTVPSPEVAALVSEHVITCDGNRYSFFHESFFDYAFARRFAGRGRDLLTMLGQSEQHLFRRAQVRQILAYERIHDRHRYISDLKGLLLRQHIRFHIKSAVLDLLAALPDPGQDEWRVLSQLTENREHPCHRFAWDVLTSSVPWFHLLDSLGLWTQWLHSDDEEIINQAIHKLSCVSRQVADRVAELLEPFAGTCDAWNNRLAYIFSFGHLEAGRRFFDLFLQLLDAGILDGFDGSHDRDLLFLLGSLFDKRPDWACEAVGHYLTRRLALCDASGIENPLGRKDASVQFEMHDEQELSACAQAAPKQWVHRVLPWVISVVERTAMHDGEKPWLDEAFQYRHSVGRYGAADRLLDITGDALAILARDRTADFESCKRRLKDTGYETLDLLLMRAYTANAGAYADEAVGYLCDNPRRLEIGYLDKPLGAALDLIEAATPHCSDECMDKLQSAILDYYTERERSRGYHDRRGLAQMQLLESCAAERLSAKAVGRLQEWRRKFGGGVTRPHYLHPRGIASYVESPVPKANADRMSDHAWLQAISAYGQRNDTLRNGRFVGGTAQLAGVLETCSKENPDRFASLALHFPENTHYLYYDAVLRGVSGTAVSSELLLALCQRCHSLPEHPCGRFIHEPIAKMAERSLPDEALNLVVWYATQHPDPEKEGWKDKGRYGSEQEDGDPHLAGINSVRGSATESMGDLIDGEASRIQHFLPALERLASDPSTAVRSCVARTLISVLCHDRDLAVRLFVRLCNAEDALLRTRCVEDFIYYALRTHYDVLKPLLDRMLRSADPAVARVGARQMCVAALALEEARSYLPMLLDGEEAWRQEAAKVLATNLLDADCRQACEDALSRLFDDPSLAVRDEAAACFRNMENAELGQYQELMRQFIRSAAFESETKDLFYALKRATVTLPDLTCIACATFIQKAGADMRDTRKATVAYADICAELIIRAYGRSDDPCIKSRCLDVIDTLMQSTIRSTWKHFDSVDR